jgi:sterol 14-demethylase
MGLGAGKVSTLHLLHSDDEPPVDYKMVNEQMSLLHNCMKEALRLCPPLILLIRYALRDVKVTAGKRTYNIPRGDMVLISPSVGMRLPEVFPNPNIFDPD